MPGDTKLCTLNFEPPLTPAVYKASRKLRSIDHEAFRQDLSVVSPVLCPTVEDFNSKLTEVIDRHAPNSHKRVIQSRSDPWYALVKDVLREAKRQRRQAEMAADWTHSLQRNLWNCLKE